VTYLRLDTAKENLNNSVNNILQRLGLQLSHAADHQASVSGEQLTGASITGDVERTGCKIIVREGQCAWITIRRARNLTQNPIVPTDIGQDDCGAQLGL
jgi:hypothetical protein